jgi:cathepsin A (carboxypeptidase C)
LDGGDGRQLHYWYVESQNDPVNDPVVLWLNGGPGCSSVGGLLTENGPIHVSEDGTTLIENDYAWNRIANVLYLESPALVGYSYNTEDIESEDDDTTSLQNYLALQDFFTNKFPEHADNDFYITGESYGGIYIPTLAVRIVNGSYPFNFKKFAIGNPYLNAVMNSVSNMYYLYYHGLAGVEQWENFQNACCEGVPTIDTCDPTGERLECALAILRLVETEGAIDEYNILNDNDDLTSTVDRTSMKLKEFKHMKMRYRNMLLRKHNLKDSNLPHYLRRSKPEPIVKPTGEDGYVTWMNRPDTRSALNIPTTVGEWQDCAGPAYNDVYDDMTPQFDYLLQHVPALIYNGDLDTVCNFLGDQWFVEHLDREITINYGPWYIGDQIGGFAKSFNNLTVITIKGSGHLVPQDQPEEAFAMFEMFLNDEDF